MQDNAHPELTPQPRLIALREGQEYIESTLQLRRPTLDLITAIALAEFTTDNPTTPGDVIRGGLLYAQEVGVNPRSSAEHRTAYNVLVGVRLSPPTHEWMNLTAQEQHVSKWRVVDASLRQYIIAWSELPDKWARIETARGASQP